LIINLLVASSSVMISQLGDMDVVAEHVKSFDIHRPLTYAATHLHAMDPFPDPNLPHRQFNRPEAAMSWIQPILSPNRFPAGSISTKGKSNIQ